MKSTKLQPDKEKIDEEKIRNIFTEMFEAWTSYNEAEERDKKNLQKEIEKLKGQISELENIRNSLWIKVFGFKVKGWLDTEIYKKSFELLDKTRAQLDNEKAGIYGKLHNISERIRRKAK
jgi:cation transport regulator ChaB